MMPAQAIFPAASDAARPATPDAANLPASTDIQPYVTLEASIMRELALIAATTALAVASTARADDQCRHSAERYAAAPTAGIERIRIEAGAGSLQISGETDAVEVMARGRACSQSEELLAATDIEIRREGTLLIISTALPEPSETRGMFFSRTAYATLDLTVDVPRQVALEVEDSSGDLEIASVGALDLADSSGDIRIRSVDGNLTLTDSSGNIDVRGVRGDVTLTDSSGDVELEEVAGDVTVPVDSSGDLDIRDVEGSVWIATDTSGDIDIADVRDDVRIDVDSSGSIDVERVGGSFTVGADASGSIRHSAVAGTVSLPRKD
jgi:polyisoprenoid-binding protein YceI